ncbi:MAG: bifunctional nuclease family protein [Acidimicrobiales bacterium]|nr:bifunctional nuclease family protein [Acidimicrobiales bacterium]
MIEMELVGVRVEMPSSAPLAILRERYGDARVLPIFIGGTEATAIAFALEEVETPRPMTHDLMRDLLEELGVSLERVTVTEIRDGVFYAELLLHGPDGTHTLSSRPSDALAIAARVGCPIYASDEVLAEAGFIEVEEDEDEDDAQLGAADEVPTEEVVEQFRDFIEHVSPEDFAN